MQSESLPAGGDTPSIERQFEQVFKGAEVYGHSPQRALVHAAARRAVLSLPPSVAAAQLARLAPSTEEERRLGQPVHVFAEGLSGLVSNTDVDVPPGARAAAAIALMALGLKRQGSTSMHSPPEMLTSVQSLLYAAGRGSLLELEQALPAPLGGRVRRLVLRYCFAMPRSVALGVVDYDLDDVAAELADVFEQLEASGQVELRSADPPRRAALVARFAAGSKARALVELLCDVPEISGGKALMAALHARDSRLWSGCSNDTLRATYVNVAKKVAPFRLRAGRGRYGFDGPRPA